MMNNSPPADSQVVSGSDKRTRVRRIALRILLAVLLLLLVAAAVTFWPVRVDLGDLASAGEPYDARILRDTWGVPHVFGATDPDVAYGLAYAHAEDDFLTIQQSLIAARGDLAAVYGIDAAPNDYMVALLRIWDVVNAQYETDLAPQTRALLEAYAAGLNHYAALHEEEVLAASLFPLGGKDIVAGSVHKSPLFFGLDNTLGEMFEEERQSVVSPRPGTARWVDMRFGSNTLAVGPGRTPDRATYLAVNSHQPWTGPVAWYEAHLHSDEGWDAVGGLFPGSPVVIHGHNRDLGWAFTVNDPDLIDVYVLEANPDNPDQYRFDGRWLDLEVRQAPITVKLLGRLRWTVKQEVLWSVYGPVVRQDHGTYAIRYAGFGKVNIFEQLYRMNRAQTFEQWRAAMAEGGLASFNVGYADGTGNIYYLYNAMLPLRAEGYDWSLYLPGDTSETLWTDYLPFDQLPQVLNPPPGFVQNANSTPFQTTVGAGNPSPDDYADSFGIDDPMTNRAWRALEQFEADPSITFDEFRTYKFDLAYSRQSGMAEYVRQLVNMARADDPTERAGLELLRNWDLRTDGENRAAALATLTIMNLAEANDDVNSGALAGIDVPPGELQAAFEQAVATLDKHFGRLDVPWAEVNRLIHGDVDLGLAGGVDVLHAVYGELQEDGRLKGNAGDSYVLLVRWDAAGEVASESIHQFGSATLDESSLHYADQAPLFAQRQLKPVWLDEADIRANLEREYRPGQEQIE